MNSVALNLARPVGSTNVGVIPSYVLKEDVKLASESIEETDVDKKIDDFGSMFGDVRKPRRNGKYFGDAVFSGKATDAAATGRDTLTDINLGMSVLASTIKVVSAVLTILGADDTTSRNDEYDDSIVTLLSTGATIVKILAGVVAEYTKLDGPKTLRSEEGPTQAPKTKELSPEELKYREEAGKLVARMTPEQVKLQQAVVKEAVEKEVATKSLNKEEATELLKTTLLHNGLPLLEGMEETSIFSSLFGASTVNKVGLAAEEAAGDISDLPQPGTLEHSVALGLFRVQQSVNQALGGLQGDDHYLTRLAGQVGLMANNYVDTGVDKIGLAEGEVEEKGGLLASLINIPNYIGQGVAGLVTAGTQPDRVGELPAGVTYSQVNNGLSPTYTALGLLTTGALGTVAYSYFLADSDLATSATSFASGAVEAIRRNDLVVAASETLSRVAGGEKWKGSWPDYGDYNNYYDQAGFSQGYYDYSDRRVPPPRPYQAYQQLGGIDREGFQTSFGENSDLVESPLDPRHDPPQDLMYQDTEVAESEKIEVFQEADAMELQDAMSLPAETKVQPIELEEEQVVNYYQPLKKEPDTPYVVYSEEHNPWNYLESGQSTEHLYHRRRRGAAQ